MPQQINLFSPIFLKREKHFSAQAMAWGLAIVAAGLGVLYAFAWFEHRALAKSVREYETRVAEQRAQYAKAAQQLLSEDARKALEAEATRLAQEIARRRALLESLHAGELGNAEGVSSYFAALARRARHGVWVTGVEISEGGAEFAVNGRMLGAELAPAYLRALGEEDVMRGRRIAELKLARRGGRAAADDAGRVDPASAEFVEFSFVALREGAGVATTGAGKR
ncbi:MAG: hypothetical protein RML56_12890 [Burkholderiales bacterium]|nr:hypothetical protein [Burkholderiales bacterium]